jgi:hypothetical protein
MPRMGFDPSVRVGENGSCLRPRGHSGRLLSPIPFHNSVRSKAQAHIFLLASLETSSNLLTRIENTEVGSIVQKTFSIVMLCVHFISCLL